MRRRHTFAERRHRFAQRGNGNHLLFLQSSSQLHNIVHARFHHDASFRGDDFLFALLYLQTDPLILHCCLSRSPRHNKDAHKNGPH
jgi:hypothetical protein